MPAKKPGAKPRTPGRTIYMGLTRWSPELRKRVHCKGLTMCFEDMDPVEAFTLIRDGVFRELEARRAAKQAAKGGATCTTTTSPRT